MSRQPPAASPVPLSTPPSTGRAGDALFSFGHDLPDCTDPAEPEIPSYSEAIEFNEQEEISCLPPF
jgi:hypothetical protein